MIQPKDVYKDSNAKRDSAAAPDNSPSKNDKCVVKNGPMPSEGIQFENKNLLLYYRRSELCRSICGLPIWMITISRDAKALKKKPTIIISSRVHSGETIA